MKISVSMIAMNEEKHIGRALSSCSFADEIVVVDGGSTDRTLEILKSDPRVVLVEHPWEGHFGNQRQISLDRCSGDWVIRLDSDEAYSEEFERKIRGVLSSAEPGIAGFTIRQCNLVGNELYYSRAADNFEWTPRIWRNLPGVKWIRHVHEYLTGIDGRVEKLDLYIVHYGFLDKKRYWRKGENYSGIEGSGYARPEELVYREYDVYPRPLSSRVNPRVPPYPVRASSGLPRVAVIRPAGFDPAEMACLLALSDTFEFTGYTLLSADTSASQTEMPIERLPQLEDSTDYLVGLEAELIDKDIVFTEYLSSVSTLQAVVAKLKFGNRVVALSAETDLVPTGKAEYIDKVKRLSLPEVDAYVAVSDRARDSLLREGISPGKIRVVPMREQFDPRESVNNLGDVFTEVLSRTNVRRPGRQPVDACVL
ncbi:MAG: glycosyltransferase [Deltaproteobacteria bacterium]|nr:glycosyltransferase [Deltaproteobacteria bacterium]